MFFGEVERDGNAVWHLWPIWRSRNTALAGELFPAAGFFFFFPPSKRTATIAEHLRWPGAAKDWEVNKDVGSNFNTEVNSFKQDGFRPHTHAKQCLVNVHYK